MKESEFTSKWIAERLGAEPSRWDVRNYTVRRPTKEEVALTPPEFRELRKYAPDNVARDQGNIGSCVGWAGNFYAETMLTLYKLDEYVSWVREDFSAEWLYYWSRKFSEPPIPDNRAGSTMKGLVKAMNKKGVAFEEAVPTDTEAPWDKTIEITETIEEIALHFKMDEYWNVSSDPESVKAAMYGLTHEFPYKMPDGSKGKAPIMCAVPIYSNFKESYDDGIVPAPQGSLLGGHAIALYEWFEIDGKTYYGNFNSWGDEVGDDGWFYFPENYPFYPHDFWIAHMGEATGNGNPCPGTCIVEYPNIITDVLNWFDVTDKKYYYGKEDEDEQV